MNIWSLGKYTNSIHWWESSVAECCWYSRMCLVCLELMYFWGVALSKKSHQLFWGEVKTGCCRWLSRAWDLQKQRLLIPSPVLEMYNLPINPIAGTIFMDTALSEQGVVETMCHGSQLMPLHKLLRLWWAGVKIHLSCGCPRQAL